MSSTLAGALKSYEHVLTCLVRDLHSHSNHDDDTLGRVSGRYFDLGDKKHSGNNMGGLGPPSFSIFCLFCLDLAAAHATSRDDSTRATNWRQTI
jgi:hypothetical protein